MKRVKEEIHHFSCNKCGKWWSVSEAPKLKIDWFCTWCGQKAKFKLKSKIKK